MESRSSALPIVLLVLLGGALALVGGIACIRQDKLAAVGEEIVYDDFGFSVRGVRHEKTIGPQSDPPARAATAQGTFCIVDLVVANHAKRVGYSMTSHTPVLVDPEGREFRVSKEGQAALEASSDAPAPPAELAHGESAVTPLVFDVPGDAHDLLLRISWGSVGDVLDYILLGDRRLALR